MAFWMRFWLVAGQILFFLLSAASAMADPPKLPAPFLNRGDIHFFSQPGDSFSFRFMNGASVLASRGGGLVVFKCSTNMTCTWSGSTFTLTASGAGGGATTALDNLAAVAINLGLVPGTAGAIDIGSAAKPWGNVWIGAAATNNAKITGTFTAARIFTLPDVASDTFAFLVATQTLANKTLTTPTISATGFANANHAHAAANSGGTLDAAAIASGTFASARMAEVLSVTDLTDYATKSGTGTTAMLTTFTALATNDVACWSGTNWVNCSLSTSFADNTFFITDDGDATKKLAFQVSGVATGTTRTTTVPDANTVLPQAFTASANNFVTGISGSTGLMTQAQPTEANLSTSDITTNNVSTSKHGFAPKAPNDATKYLDGTGAYSVPAGGGGGGSSTITVANEGATGTTANKLAKLTGAPSTAIIGATTDTGLAIGIVTSGAGTTGSATITINGTASCVFDGATTAGNFVTRSGATAGNCVDAGSTISAAAGTGVIGIVLSTNGGAGTYSVLLKPDLRNVFGTANRVTIAGTAGGGIQLTGPQDLGTGSSPTFSGLTVNGTINAAFGTALNVTSGGSATFTAKSGGTGSGNNTGAASFGSGDNTGTGGNTGNVTIQVGDIPASGTGTPGTLTIRSSDIANGSNANTVAATTIRGGDTAGTGAGGAVTFRPGGSSNATPGNPGLLNLEQTFKKGATVTANALQCFSADYTVTDCGTSVQNWLGPAVSTTDPVRVGIHGIFTLLYDATVSPSAGWFACRSGSVGGKVTAQSAACTAGQQVGIVAVGGSSVTSGLVMIARD